MAAGGSSANSKALSELASQADSHFEKQQYDQCLEKLTKLQEQRRVTQSQAQRLHAK